MQRGEVSFCINRCINYILKLLFKFIIVLYSINEKRTPPNTLSLNKQKDTSNINKEIQHIQGDLNNDLYAVPMKNNTHEFMDELPAGWEKHEGTKYSIPFFIQ